MLRAIQWNTMRVCDLLAFILFARIAVCLENPKTSGDGGDLRRQKYLSLNSSAVKKFHEENISTTPSPSIWMSNIDPLAEETATWWYDAYYHHVIALAN